jgi:PleD family two-component response regulator
VIDDIAPHFATLAACERARVLLADDNPDMRDYVSHLLSSRWDVDAVADGQAALGTSRRPDSRSGYRGGVAIIK